MPELKPIVFTPVTEKNVGQLRLLNTTIFPVRYNDDFYKKVYVNPKLAQFGLYNDTPIGAVAGRIEESKETKKNTQLYIMTLGVLEPYRRLGAGAKLLQYLIDLVKTDSEFKELQTIVLHVQTSNASALKFYAKFGFEVTGLIENYYQKLDPPDCHILTLQVDRCLEPEPEPEPAAAAESARQARVKGLQEEEKEGAQAGAANGYGTIAVDLAEEARKLKEMKAKGLNPDGTPYMHMPGLDQPPPVAMKKNPITGEMEEFHSEKLKDDLPEEEVVGEGEEIEIPCGDDY